MSTLSRYSYDMQIEGLIVGHTEETHFFIIITKFLNRYSKAKCYGHQHIHERCVRSEGVVLRYPVEVRVRLPKSVVWVT